MFSAERRASIVLLYHRMGSPIVRSICGSQYVLPWMFRSQLKMLMSYGYQPARLASIVSDPKYATGHFAVTFDDGYENVGRPAYPILRELNVPATLFMVTSGVGKTNEWDQRIGDRVEKMLSLEMLRRDGFRRLRDRVSHCKSRPLAGVGG